MSYLLHWTDLQEIQALDISSENALTFKRKSGVKEQAQEIPLRKETGTVGGWSIY